MCSVTKWPVYKSLVVYHFAYYVCTIVMWTQREHVPISKKDERLKRPFCCCNLYQLESSSPHENVRETKKQNERERERGRHGKEEEKRCSLQHPFALRSFPTVLLSRAATLAALHERHSNNIIVFSVAWAPMFFFYEFLLFAFIPMLLFALFVLVFRA